MFAILVSNEDILDMRRFTTSGDQLGTNARQYQSNNGNDHGGNIEKTEKGKC